MKITKNLEGWFGNRRCHGWAVGLASFRDCCCCCDRQFQVIRSVIYSLRLRGWSSHLLDIWHGWSDDYVALGVIQLPLWIDDQQFRFVCNGFDTLNHLLVGLLHHVVSVHFHDPVAQFQSSSFSCRSNVNFTDKLALQTNKQTPSGETHTQRNGRSFLLQVDSHNKMMKCKNGCYNIPCAFYRPTNGIRNHRSRSTWWRGISVAQVRCSNPVQHAYQTRKSFSTHLLAAPIFLLIPSPPPLF